MATPALATPARALRLPVLFAAALLAGFGIFAVTIWIVTQSWSWFLLGVPSAFAGGFLLFQRATGADAA